MNDATRREEGGTSAEKSITDGSAPSGAAVPLPDALLQLSELVAGYVPGVDILQRSTMHVSSGEMVGIIGPNGAGKSTLIKAVFGLVPIRSGSVSLDLVEITGTPGFDLVKLGVGYVPQVRNVFGALSVEENLRMGAFLRPHTFAERRDHVFELFDVLADRRGARAEALSGGQRQVLAMGRALMMEPKLLLLDEPSAGLSPTMQDEVFERISEIQRSGVSILIVEQNAYKALRICDRGYVLDQGSVAYTGTGDELVNDPKVIELYLGSLARKR